MAGLGTLTLNLVAQIGQFVEPISQAERHALASSKKMSGGFTSVGNSSNQAKSQLDLMTSALNRQQTEAEKTAKVLGFLATSGKALAAGFTIDKAIEMADSYGQMAAQIEIATKKTGQYNYVQDRLLKTANTTYRPLKEAQQVWLDTGGALEKVGFTMEQSLDITDSLSFAYTANATSAERAQSATNAVTDSIVKNKVESASWASIVRAIPSITADIAKQMNVTEKEVLKLGATGKLSARDLAQALEQSRDKNEELANSMRNSAKDGFVRLINAATVYIGKLNETSGATNTLAAALSFLGENIEFLADGGIVIGIGYLTTAVAAKTLAVRSDVAAMIAQREATLVQAAAQVKVIGVEALRQKQLASLAAQELRMAQIALQGALTRDAQVSATQRLRVAEIAYEIQVKKSTASQLAYKAAQEGITSVGKGVLGVFGGPLGLGIAAATVATGFLMMKDSSDKMKPALVDQGLTVEDLTKKYISLNEEQRNFEQSKLREKIEEDVVAIKKAGGEYYNLTVAMRNAWSTEQMTAYKELVEEVTVKGLETNDAFIKIKSTGLFSQKELDEISKYNVGFSSANKTLKDHQKILDTLEKKNKEVTKSQKEQKNAVNDLAKSYADLTDQQQKSIDKLNRSLEVDAYNKLFVASGGEIERAEHYQKYKAEAGMKPNDLLSNYERGVLDKNFYSKNYNFSDSDRKKMAGALAIVSAHSLENLAKAGGLPPNLLGGVITQESGGKNVTSPTGAQGFLQTTGGFREQHGLTVADNTKNPSKVAQAAIKSLNDAYKVFGNWNDAVMAYNGGVAGTRAFKAGRISDKVTARGGYQLIDGKGYLSPAKAKEMQNYPNQVLKYTAGLNGSSKADQSMSMPYQEDILKWQNSAIESQAAIADKQKDFARQLAQPLEQLKLAHEKTNEDIQEAFANNPAKLKEMLAKQSILYNSQRGKLIAETEDEYNQYFAFEKDRITQINDDYEHQKKLVNLSVDYSAAKKKEIISAIDRQKQHEIEAVKREENQQVQSAFEAYLNETEIVIRRYAVEREEILKTHNLTEVTRQKLLEAYKMGVFSELDNSRDAVFQTQLEASIAQFQRKDPMGYQHFDLQNQYSESVGNLNNDYSNQVSGINQLEDEEQRNAQLLEAHEQYRQAKAEINALYDQQEKDLRDAQLDMQLASGEQIFGSMTEMLRSSGAERTGIYRAMLVAEKSVAIARSVMAIQTGIAEAAANPFPYNLGAMATVAAATAGIVSSITSVAAGFSGGGYTGDGDKYAAAGIVHKGEVVWSQEDIKRWGGVAQVETMRLSGGLGGFSDGGIVGGSLGVNKINTQSGIDLAGILSNQQPQIIINTPPGMSARTEQRDGKTYVTIEEVREYLGQQINSPNSQFSKNMRQNYEVKPRR